MARRAIVSRKRGLTPSSHALMHSPLSMQEVAQRREASGPSPWRTMSSTPLMTSAGLASARPAGFTLGQTSTHLPHRVQASSMSSTRWPSAVSNEISWFGCILRISSSLSRCARRSGDLESLAHKR
jgi:hypothetical protein